MIETATPYSCTVRVCICRTLLYTAPEILATGITHPDQVGTGTIEGDVYSYSLIMYELLTKKTAFGEFASYMRIEEILSCLVGLKPVPKMVIVAIPVQ